MEDAYRKYLQPVPTPMSDVDVPNEPDVTCPRCKSKDVDISRGYRGEYRCLNCGLAWQS